MRIFSATRSNQTPVSTKPKYPPFDEKKAAELTEIVLRSLQDRSDTNGEREREVHG